MKTKFYYVTFVLSLLVISTCLNAKVSLPHIFKNNIVLQRDIPIKIWGWANPGEKITVQLLSQKVETVAEKDKKWMVTLEPIKAGGPYNLLVKGENEIELKNILVGDVWICSGQSNMQWKINQLKLSDEEIGKSDFPEIRLFTVPRNFQTTKQEDILGGEWILCNKENIKEFSAVAFFFGKEIHTKHNVPVGLISTNWGGTVVEAWTSEEYLRKVEDFNDILDKMKGKSVDMLQDERTKMVEGILKKYNVNGKGMVHGKPIWAAADLDLSEWKEMDLPGNWEEKKLTDLNGVVWFRKELIISENCNDKNAILSFGKIEDDDITYINGAEIGRTRRSYNYRKYQVDKSYLKPGKNVIAVRVEDIWGIGGFVGAPEDMYLQCGDEKIDLTGNWKYRISDTILPRIVNLNPNHCPTSLFNGMISPLTNLAIKGAIWYQGESNDKRAYQYRKLFPLMINDWRYRWQQGDFPFLFVQLANYKKQNEIPVESNWAELREAQLMTLSLPNTGMAVTIDIGDANNIHPKNKWDVGKRLALAADKIAYGKDIVYSGPIYNSMKIEGNKIRLRFKHTGSGLIAKDRYGYLKGFTIAGEDKKFVWAKAYIDNNEVVVFNYQIENPVAVRYGWSDNPNDVNLYNKEGLPASPFRTDKWKGITEP